MLDYKLLEALAAVAGDKSFQKAGQALGLTQSAVSQRVRLLEEQLGQPLLVRTDPIRPTRTGKKLLRHYEMVSMLEKGISDLVARSSSPAQIHGSFPIALNAESLSTWFLPALRPASENLPIVVELIIADQDRTIEKLRDGEVFACVTSKSNPPIGCRSHYLGAMRYRCVANREFSRRYFPKGFDREAAFFCPRSYF